MILKVTGELLASMKGPADLIKFFETCCQKFPGSLIIFLVIDLLTYYKKLESIDNAEKNRLLREAFGEKTCPKKVDSIYLEGSSEQEIEQMLVAVQVYAKDRCLFLIRLRIHMCLSKDTPAWLVKFTEQISIVPEMTYSFIT